jgi:hypothetical protein
MKIFIVGGATLEEADEKHGEQIETMRKAMGTLGEVLVKAGHDLLVCSPYEGSVDLEVVRSVAAHLTAEARSHLEFHYPDSASVREELERLRASLSLTQIRPFPCAPPLDESSRDGWLYAWVLAQLSAMNHSHAVIALGGKLNSSANLLLLLAEGQQKNVLPLLALAQVMSRIVY